MTHNPYISLLTLHSQSSIILDYSFILNHSFFILNYSFLILHSFLHTHKHWMLRMHHADFFVYHKTAFLQSFAPYCRSK
jgi:hypothetical protein